ncbi:hypothetical protein MRX96_003066 [Rhipicephalus microplus]
MFTAPYHPTSNERAERKVRELKCVLRKQSQGTVACKVSRFLFKEHSMLHMETGRTPAEFTLRRSFRSALSSMQPDVEDAMFSGDASSGGPDRLCEKLQCQQMMGRHRLYLIPRKHAAALLVHDDLCSAMALTARGEGM